MEAKKYRAKNMVDAINRIKQDIGPDAIIISTRKISKSISNPYEDNTIEVEAMASDTNAYKPQKEKVWKNFFDEAKPKNRNLNKEAKIDAILKVKNKEQLFNQKEDAPIEHTKPISAERDWRLIQNELISIRDMLYLVTKSGLNTNFLNNHPECLNVYAKLIKFGVSEQCAQNLINASYESMCRKDFNIDDIIQAVFEKVLKNIEIKNIFKNEKHKINAFVGPTGVGKTTTIAKLAAILSLKERKKVGLISIDNFRIGAFEQLKAYAAIIGIPCMSAFTVEDLKKAIQKMQNVDTILIDTAGHSHLDNKRMKELKKFIIDSDYNMSISTHLVLSSTTSKVTMRESVDKFKILNPDSYIFTKVDETTLKGVIVEQIMDFNMPISYITNGQKVPEDIMKASKKNILNLLLN